MTTPAEEVLAHYGTKGMKWGVRKSRGGVSSTGGGHSRKNPEPAHEQAQHVSTIHTRVSTSKSTKMLSNKELQDAITRMNLERQYSQLSGGKDKTRAQKGTKFVSELILGAGKQQATQALNKQMTNQVNEMMKKAAKP